MNALTTNLAVIRASLAEEKKRDIGRLRVDETGFLPAALEVIERPVSPTARLTAKVLLGGVAALGLWLTFGRTDIVASAPGKIVPTGAVQLVQPAEAGVVRRILVHDGDHVTKGQVLVLLDPTVSTAEAAQARKAYETAAFSVARTRAVIDGLDGKGFVFTPPAGADATTVEAQKLLAQAKLADVQASITAQVANGRVAQSDIATARVQVAKLTETLPLLDEQIAANEQLLAKGFVSKLKVIEMRRQRLGQARDRDAAIESIQRANAQSAGAASTMAKARTEVRAALFDELVKANAEMQLRQEELAKTQQRSTFQELRAPVTGTIGQLSVHTEGGVVEAAKPIMTVVPADGRMVAEVKLLNRDAGFVSVGQKVDVKLEAFPFARYGSIPGKVLAISPDAIDDEKLGPVYVVRVALDRTRIDRGDRNVAITPGMSAVADIVTGDRSFLSYLTSPVDEAKGSALRER
ncbi:secretion protein HylD [Sphingomonas sp. Leaf357]|uniref:HlyD family type I secretion periplasmic adaptor subunit n=1 Tax=Sphingomonas sp. Leaf357 TaxID=1736350 RepID=UPI0006FA2A52|nr:HlyD family type I secretion periplasmic adaptor subunit [Sphingomonas sp. Leaf357]KQS04193.1 secretion protein HylD [Sphingomonas sp. Leaf357]